jgi:DNA-binding transcriptional ArsR family regulator
MTEPLSDRLLDMLGDPIAREVLRALLERERSQTDLIEDLGLAQATVSRVVKVLRAAGLVAPTSRARRQLLAVTAHAETVGILLAADRLAEQLIEREQTVQAERSSATRRAAIQPAKREGSEATSD